MEAALAKRPLQQEAAGAALRCALIPALATVGRCRKPQETDLLFARLLLNFVLILSKFYLDFYEFYHFHQ